MPALFVPDVPQCGPRVKEEGSEYHVRNRDGSMKNFLDHSKNKNFVSPRPAPRTGGSAECEEQMMKARGSMSSIFDQKKNQSYCSPRRPPRCPTPEAQVQYDRARGSMTELFGGHGGKDPRNRGPLQPRAVRPEAAQIATMNKGLGTKKLFETYGKVTPRPPPMSRVKPEAEDIANQNKGLETKNLFQNYGKMSAPGPKASLAVSDEAQEMANLDRGGRTKKLLTMDAPSGR